MYVLLQKVTRKTDGNINNVDITKNKIRKLKIMRDMKDYEINTYFQYNHKQS